ncbi:ankyrin, partial [Patellaria atrata CBS 101060]
MSDGRSIYSVLLKSLSFPREDARLRTIRAPHKETCQWVFEQAEFKDWRDTSKIKDHHGFLWIKGKPGSGKSTMWKTVYNRVRQQHRSGVITYCFNARAANPLERSTHGMYRSLVHQLLRALPQFQDSFVEEFSTKAKLLSSSKGDPANAKWEVDEWTIPELQVFLTDVIRSLGAQPLSIFIDALDEGEEADVRPMVWFLEELGHVAISSNSLFHVCLSSRHYPNITIKKGVSLTLDHHQGHSDDIATFVHDRLNGGERPEMENLRHDICHRASGVFLWVILAVQILNELHDQGEVDAMSQRLSELPGELNDVFKELLLRDTVDLERTILLLQWVLFAKEPLSPAQLYSAIKTGSQSQDEFDFTIPNEKVIERYILRCSKGLIEISKTWSSNAVQFIHETARDFLLKDGLVILNPNLSSSLSGLSHDQLKNGCFRYFLKLENRRSSYNGKKPSQLRKLNEEFPLLSYAVHRMFHHADDAQRDGISQNDFLREFGVENKGKLEKCVDYRSKLDEESKETGGKYGNALQAASFTGKAEAVELLVKKGANIHAKGGFYGNALQAASHRGHKGIIELLLREGADVNAGSGRYHGALGAAADEEITELLLANGADITANGGTCLVHAAQTGTPAFKLLLEKGVDVNAQWKNLWFPPGPTSLHNAAEYPHMDSHELMLIKNRMRDLEETELLREPLSEAEKSAWYRRLEEEEEQKQYCESEIKRALERVELLLVYKADVNLRGGRLGYPLQAASFGGSHEIVKVLLDNGAEVNMKGGRFGSALIAAASEGFDTTVELLLENGADVN